MSEYQDEFYSERIQTPPKRGRFVKNLLMITLSVALGTYIGSNFIPNNVNTDSLLPANPQESRIKIESTTSPVVPIAKKVTPAVVAISISATVQDFFGRSVQQGTGSGFIIDKQGHIVTNNHVVENAEQITVILSTGKQLPAKVVGRDPQTDLAVIQVTEKNLPVVELGDSSKLQVGELSVAIGSPYGTEYAGTVTQGIISGLNRKIDVGDRTMNLIQTDAAINPGNSGGALVNNKGQVIGINTLKLVQSNFESMGFAIPINEAKPIIDQLIRQGKIVRPILGIAGETVTKEISDNYDVPTGVLVRQVQPGTGAAKAGVNSGDIVTKIEGKRVESIEDLIRIIQGHKVGDKINIEVYNKVGRTKTYSVTLTANSQTP